MTDEEDECTCSSEDHPKHSCPYAEEIGDDHNPEYCSCCPVCTRNCMEDI